MTALSICGIARSLGRCAPTSGGGFLCQCPVATHGKGHGDRNPSLSIAVGNNGALIVKCFGGCDSRNVLAELRRRGLIEDRDDRREDKPDRAPRPRPATTSRPPDEDEQARLKLALDIFDQSVDAHGTETESYLNARKLDLIDGADTIRFHRNCPFGRGQRAPCMVVLFRDNLTDKPVGIQRTRLPLGGWRRGQKMERKNLGRTGLGSIKIDQDEDVLHGLTIAEGLETALAGRMLGYRPVWATGGKGTLKGFPVLPEPVQSLSIHWEPDAAEDVRECLDRWRNAGRETIILKSLCGKDTADALFEGRP